MKTKLEFTQISLHDFVESLVKGLEVKDLYTSGHSIRVAHLAQKLAELMDLNPEMIFTIHIAGHLHDIGKIGIRDAILNKKGNLTRSEYEEIKKHSTIGYQIINQVTGTQFSTIANIIKHHHEKYDGTGYPTGLSAKEIPLGSRIIAIADTFDAIATPRPYRKALPIKEAIKEINQCQDNQFDPQIVKMINKIYKEKPSFLYNLINKEQST
ncbi:hypothetical protein JCM16358_05970 [Halanaerocella petrolearia]